jgi:hypothetical protein
MVQIRLFNPFFVIIAIGFAKYSTGQINSYQMLAETYNQANYIETYRTFPSEISVQSHIFQPSEYLHLLAQVITDIDAKSIQSAYNGTWQMPDILYPALELNDNIYSRVISRQEYIQFFNDLLKTYPDNSKLQTTVSFRSSDFRVIDAYYLALVISRFYFSFGYLPAVVDPKIATPKGLFPWEIPDDKLMFLSNVQNHEGVDYNKYSEYYYTSSMDYELYSLGKEIIADETDQKEAGQRIFDYAHQLANQTPYGLYYDLENNFGFVYNSYEMIRYMQGTSGAPQRPKAALYPAIGIPHGYDERGYGGIVYINGEGWINAEDHAAYGSDYHDNAFFGFFTSEDPFPSDPRAVNIMRDSAQISITNDVIKLSNNTAETRAFWINPSDILIYGADYVIETAMAGDFNTIIVTVKSYIGNIYFDFDDPLPQSDRVKDDVLVALPQLAKARGIKLLIGIHDLADYKSAIECGCGQQFLYEFAFGYSTDFFITPCNDAHKDFTKDVIAQLYDKYDFDGIVFIRNYTFYDGWGNSECMEIALPDKASKEAYLTAYVNDLGSYSKSLDDTRQTFYMTGPWISVSGLTVSEYFDDPDPNGIDPNSIDGIILSVSGFTWLFDENNSDFDSVYNKFISSNNPIYVTASLSKEWEYPPEFYRGLARFFSGLNASGIIVIANNSGEGELGSAFVKQHYGKLNEIRFLEPPPAQDEIASLEENESVLTTPLKATLLQNYPNPFNSKTTIQYQLPKTSIVNLSIYSLNGQLISTLVHKKQTAGYYKVVWDASDFASGVYIYSLETETGFNQSQKLLLIK